MELGVGDLSCKLLDVVPRYVLGLPVRWRDVGKAWVRPLFLDRSLEQVIDGADCLAEPTMHHQHIEAVGVQHLVQLLLQLARRVVDLDRFGQWTAALLGGARSEFS